MPIPVSAAADWMTWQDVQDRTTPPRVFTTEEQTSATTFLNDALGRAAAAAACFLNPTALPSHVQAAAMGIIAAAVLRRMDDVKGGTQYQAAGPFGVNTDTKLRSDRILTVADRDELKQLCRSVRGRRRGGSIRTPIGY